MKNYQVGNELKELNVLSSFQFRFRVQNLVLIVQVPGHCLLIGLVRLVDRCFEPLHKYHLNIFKILSFLNIHLTLFNPLVTNGLSHPYQMDDSILILRGIGRDF